MVVSIHPVAIYTSFLLQDGDSMANPSESNCTCKACNAPSNYEKIDRKRCLLRFGQRWKPWDLKSNIE